MSTKKGGRARAAQPTRDTPVLGSLNLIHRNKVPEALSMRVTARFDLPQGVDLSTLQNTLNFAFGPLGNLMMRRALDAG